MSDFISRQDVLDVFRNLSFEHIFQCGEYYGEDERQLTIINAEKAIDVIKSLPSAEPESSCITILKRKVDLQSILQAIKTDKIRVWMSYDGKIRFRNTKTGNEISVEPYYDMEGNTNNE